MGTHAVLSPSSAHRWIPCPPSARANEGLDESSEYAEEGTLAHSIGETFCNFQLGRLKRYEAEEALQKHKQHKLYKPEMLSYCKDYANFVIEKYNGMPKGTVIEVEHKVNLSTYVPEGFGTIDIKMVGGTKLLIIDKKYGQGVKVSAVRNKQLMTYAVGLLVEWSFIFDIETVEMWIFQPRLDNISSWSVSANELLNWAKDELNPAAVLAWKGDGIRVAGDHCKFCKVKGSCRGLYDYNKPVFDKTLVNPATLSDEEIADILDRGKIFVEFINAVQDYALKKALNSGKQWPGYKVVSGRSNRSFLDVMKVKSLLKKAGYSDDVLYTRELISLTAIESLLSKKRFNKLLGSLVTKPQGRPTLVPLSDDRAAFSSIQSAMDDFKDLL